jgi:dihydropteroate synthase
MAIVNRTPDSFHRPGLTWEDAAAMDRVHQAVAEGADIVDIAGAAAKPESEVSPTEEIRRTASFVPAVCAAYPDLVISVDTWRHEMGRAACEAGANLLNDTLGRLGSRAGGGSREIRRGPVCSHAGGLPPRTRPFRVAYSDVMTDVLNRTLGLAARATRVGVNPARIVIDPAHDFGKNTWHFLEISRRLDEMTATGWPVLIAASHKDFVGETLGADVEDRLAGTLAVTALAAWLGARIFRAHDVLQTRQALDMVAAIKGDLTPAGIIWGLA